MKRNVMKNNDLNNQTIQIIDIKMVKPNDYNPRKITDTSESNLELNELADSIKKIKLIHPIVVRFIMSKNIFEIVCGERRYWASILAGKETIKCIVVDLSDEEAIQWCISENLQREDISPIEESKAFCNYMKKFNYKIEDLCIKFGKSEKYIRNRLKFENLIEDFAKMVDKMEVSLVNANILSCYSHEIQKEIYDTHFHPDCYEHFNWCNFSSKNLKQSIEIKFSTQLSNFNFNKSKCLNCPYNTANACLFGEELNNASCMNKDCLISKNNQYLFEEVKKIVLLYPCRPLIYQDYDNTLNNVIELLQNYGYELIKENSYYPLFTKPQKPLKENYEKKEEEFKEKLKEYNEQYQNYLNLLELENSGEITIFTRISKYKIEFHYTHEKNKANNNYKKVDQIQILETKDNRNREIAIEKTVNDVKNLIEKIEFNNDFSELEEQLMYYIMLSDLDKKYFVNFNFEEDKYYIKDEEKEEIINNLTEEQKHLIIRNYLVKNLIIFYPCFHIL